jgi:Mn2+/Fe2+ NRAMP family transporter
LPPAAPRTTRRVRRFQIGALVAVIGPGAIAGLADDDPAGITTYSIQGTEYGYELLWVVLISVLALICFHLIGARLGAVTGQGLTGLVRQRFGAHAAIVVTLALVAANIGTTAAEFAGIAVGFEIFGVPRHASVPVAALLVSLLVLRGGFRGIERILLALSTVFVCYVGSGILAGPDWSAALRGLVVPTVPPTSQALVVITATLGTTLAPWGLAFIQSYVVDKRLSAADLRYLHIDVVTGSVLTGVIAFFVVVACAATLNPSGLRITDASQAASALEPLAGRLAAGLFAIGIIGAGLLAASILPLSTAYAVSDLTGSPAELNDPVRTAPLFYGTFGLVTIVGVTVVLIPGIPLASILVLTQVANGLLLLPIIVFMHALARDRRIMGEHAAPRWAQAASLLVIVVVTGCVLALFALLASGP